MNVRARRLRRAGAAIALGIGMVGGVIGVAAGTSGAATPTRGDAITASSAPSVPTTGSTHAAGSLTVTLRGHTSPTPATDSYVDLVVSAESGHVSWTAASVSSTGVTIVAHTFTGARKTRLWIEITPLATSATATLDVAGITYKTTVAKGTVSVTPDWTTRETAGGPTTYGTFNPSSVVNAVAPGAPAGVAGHRTILATSTPFVGAGAATAVGGWTLEFSGTVTSGEGWTSGETVTVRVQDHTGDNCSSATDYVLFTGAPTAKVTASSKVSAAPTVSVSTYGDGTCRVNDHNVLTLTFTNSGTFTGSGQFTITVSGVRYAIGAGTSTGTVSVVAAVDAGTTGFATSSTELTSAGATKAAGTTGASNAAVTLIFVTANTPSVTVGSTAYDAHISPIDVIETAPDELGAGYVCIGLTTGNVFNTAASATAKVAKGTAGVTTKVTYETSGGAAATASTTAKYARFKVTKPSNTTASTFSVSGLAVNASTPTSSTVATVTHVASSTCVHGSPTTIGSAIAFSIGAQTTQIYGATADATAAKQLETEFPATGANGSCPGTVTNTKNTRPVVLATTVTYQDALASSYLAGYLDTGTLLTPTGQLASVTLQALRTEGVTQVYIVGGPLAVSTAVENALKTTPAYQCGGTGVLKTGSTTRDLQVTRIWGQTQYDTAQKIAQEVPGSYIDTWRFPGAYAGVNATGGNGKFNDTAGSASTAPESGGFAKTAILASGVEFQDAMAASGVAWRDNMPILLTTPTALSSQAEAAIADLTITQVIVTGGPLAISNTVVKSLEGLGISVLRIAGKNYTDTAVQLAKFEATTANGLGWSPIAQVAVARGNGFTDGIAGAVITGSHTMPLLLTLNPTTVGTYLTAFLVASGRSGKGIDTTASDTISTLEIFGGPLAITPATINKMETDIS